MGAFFVQKDEGQLTFALKYNMIKALKRRYGICLTKSSVLLVQAIWEVL